jgi:hypothetical protein
VEEFSMAYIRKLLLAAALPLALMLVGCTTHTSIADLTRDPAHYTGKDVTITGQATDVFGGLGQGLFQVDDGTGKIWVLSQNYGLPANNAKVSVTGQVQQGINVGGRNFGVLFRQSKPLD